MTRASEARRAHRLARRKRGAPKKDFSTDPDRATIEIAEVLRLIGFNRTEAYDLSAAIREGRLVEASPNSLALRLPVTVAGRVETLRQKSERESTSADWLRRSLLAARLIIADRARTQEEAIRALDNLLTIAAIQGVEKLRKTVEALAGKRRKRHVARKTH